MKKVVSLILAAMMVLTAAFALAAPSISVEDLVQAAPAKNDLTKEAQAAHDAFAPGLPEASEETEDDAAEGTVIYKIVANNDPEAAVAAIAEDTTLAVSELLGTDNAVVNEVADIEVYIADDDIEVKMQVASAYAEGTKLAIVVIVGEEQFVFEGAVDATGIVSFTLPASVAAKIQEAGIGTIVIANAE